MALYIFCEIVPVSEELDTGHVVPVAAHVQLATVMCSKVRPLMSSSVAWTLCSGRVMSMKFRNFILLIYTIYLPEIGMLVCNVNH